MRITRAVTWLDGRGLVWVFVAGLVLRLVLARRGGLPFDVDTFRAWSDRLVDVGPRRFYAPGYFADYPPGYLYVLYAIGRVTRALGMGAPSVAVLKLPAIAADLALAHIVVRLAEHVTPHGDRDRYPWRLAAASAILFNPAIVLVSSTWGQVDSLLALCSLGAVLLITSARPSLLRDTGGAALLAVGLVTKPQTVFALPIIAVVLVRRRRPFRDAIGPLVISGAVAVAVVVLLFAPFGVTPTEIAAFYRDAGAVYPLTSLWAFNVWGIVGFYRPDSGVDAVQVLGFDAVAIGGALFVGATAALIARAWRALDRAGSTAVATFGAAAVTMVGFACLTRSHERYLYLGVAALAPFVALRPFRWALIGLSLLLVLDLHFVYVYFVERSGGDAWTVRAVYDLVFGTTRDALQRKILSAVTAAACLVVAWRGWRWLPRT